MSDKINWENMSSEMIDFAIQQAKEKLNSTIKCSGDLDKKTFFVLSGLFVTISAFLGFLFNKINITQQNYFFVLPILIISMGFIFAFLKAFSIIKTRLFQTPGNSPTELLKEGRSDYDLEYLKLSYLISYDERIEGNLKLNKNNGSCINKCIKIIYLSIINSLISFIMILYLVPFPVVLGLVLVVVLSFSILFYLFYE